MALRHRIFVSSSMPFKRLPALIALVALAALAACAFVLDFLKARAPFWSKEVRDAGSRWVSARDADEEALKRW